MNVKWIKTISYSLDFQLFRRINGIIDNDMCYHSLKKLQTNNILSSHGGQKPEEATVVLNYSVALLLQK